MGLAPRPVRKLSRPAPPRNQNLSGCSGTSASRPGRPSGIQTSPGSMMVNPSKNPVNSSRSLAGVADVQIAPPGEGVAQSCLALVRAASVREKGQHCPQEPPRGPGEVGQELG